MMMWEYRTRLIEFANYTDGGDSSVRDGEVDVVGNTAKMSCG